MLGRHRRSPLGSRLGGWRPRGRIGRRVAVPVAVLVTVALLPLLNSPRTAVAATATNTFGYASLWSDFMCRLAETCALADVDGDGRADAVSFVKNTRPELEGDVYVALSTGSGFGGAVRWSDFMCRMEETCALGDVNGDGKADAVSFVRSTRPAQDGDVYVALSTGSGFAGAVRWSDFMCRLAETCALADVDGDGRADAVSFVKNTRPELEGDVYVALSTGSGFGGAVRWSDRICVADETCALADVGGDPGADAVAFVKSTRTGEHEGDVWVSLATRWPATQPRTPRPLLFPVQVSGTAVTLRWEDRSRTEDTFEVFRRDPATGSLTSVATVASTDRPGTIRSYTFPDTISAGSRVCYEIGVHYYGRTGINWSNDECTAPPGPLTPPVPLPWGSITPLDTAAHSGIFSSVAVGADGLPLVSYYRGGSSDDLMVARCGDAACTSATTSVVDTTGNVGWSSSLQIGRDGLALISYRDNTHENLKVAHCSNATCSLATITTIDSGRVGTGTSLTIGADGLGLIVYRERSAGETVRVAHCQNVACTAAVVSTLDSVRSPADEAGARAAVTTGSNGFGLISYADRADLKVAACTNADCSTAITSTADNGGGLDSSITVGRDGLGLIVSRTGTLTAVAHCVNLYCTATAPTIVEQVPGTETSIAIGGDGLGVMSYHDVANHDLKVAHCTDLACTATTTTSVDAFDDVGRQTSITVGRDGLPVVSYYDLTNGDLRVARCPDVRCAGQFVTPF
jgi:hypothetical protein